MTKPAVTSRRLFLQSSAAAAAATALPSRAVSAALDASASDRPRFATIGLRNQGWLITQWALGVADILALVDVDQGVLASHERKLAERTGGKKIDTYGDYRRVLERDDIDAVMIATPDHWHTKIAVEAMLAGKDVYCEKPLTLTIDEGKIIERVVEQTGRVFQVGTMQRSGWRFLQAVAMVRSGRIGKVRKIKCGINGLSPSPVIPTSPVPSGLDWDTWLGPAPAVEYRALPEMRKGYGGGVPLYSNGHYAFRNWHAYAGGKLTDWGAHHVDIACWALGLTQGEGAAKVKPLGYKMAIEHKDGYPVVDDRYNAAVWFDVKVDLPGGVEMLIRSGGDNGILFEGEKGRFFVNRGKIVGKPIENLADDPLPEGALEQVYGGPVPKNHAYNFVDAMRSREQPISDVWSHNRMLEICHLANIAMRLGREVAWDPTRRAVIGDDQAQSFLSRESRKGYEIEGV